MSKRLVPASRLKVVKNVPTEESKSNDVKPLPSSKKALIVTGSVKKNKVERFEKKIKNLAGERRHDGYAFLHTLQTNKTQEELTHFFSSQSFRKIIFHSCHENFIEKVILIHKKIERNLPIMVVVGNTKQNIRTVNSLEESIV